MKKRGAALLHHNLVVQAVCDMRAEQHGLCCVCCGLGQVSNLGSFSARIRCLVWTPPTPLPPLLCKGHAYRSSSLHSDSTHTEGRLFLSTTTLHSEMCKH